jgi:hypothetical protein
MGIYCSITPMAMGVRNAETIPEAKPHLHELQPLLGGEKA